MFIGLSKRHAELRAIEERIVSEAMFTAGCVEDFALDGAAKVPETFAVPAEGNDADKAPRSMGDGRKPIEQQCIVFLIGCVGTRIAGRMHTRRAVQSVDVSMIGRPVSARSRSGRTSRLGQSPVASALR